MIFPGLGANDTSTTRRCALLDSLGYHTHPGARGFNFRPRTGVLERCEHDLRRLRQRFGRKPSLVGWSLRRPLRPRAGQKPARTRCAAS